jgi:hypothetical protein
MTYLIMNHKYAIWVYVACVLFFACTNSHSTDIVKSWQKKEVSIPQEIQWKSMGRDTVGTELLQSFYKILTYM